MQGLPNRGRPTQRKNNLLFKTKLVYPKNDLFKKTSYKQKNGFKTLKNHEKM